jgi:hypothetical protein
MDTDAVLSNLRFSQSHRFLALQTIDVLVSAVRRACNGHLRPKGWRGLGRLMPSPEHRGHAVRFLALEDLEDQDVAYSDVVRLWDKEAKRMIVS